MGNGTVFTVWERTEPADRAEVEYYLDAFAQEDALYPKCSRRWRKPGLPDMDFELQTLWI